MDPAIAEIFGRAGFDWLSIDTEHNAHTTLTVRSMLQAALHTPAVVLVRPLRLDPDEIRRFLDLGSPGVFCPFINNHEDASRLVQACRYAPAGIRGYGPYRASSYGFDSEEYFSQANDAMICIPIVESNEAIENIEDIVSVDGIEGVVVGPMDLSISLGCFKKFEDDTYLAAVEKVRKACKKYAKAMGTGCTSLEHAKQCAEKGDTLLLLAGDDVFLAREATRCLKLLRD
jgi:2-keto-3-deoxy-L-rhamnonate aldolase RhmA